MERAGKGLDPMRAARAGWRNMVAIDLALEMGLDSIQTGMRRLFVDDGW